MAAFLAETLEKLLRYFCSKFVKKDVMSKASTASKLIKINLNDANNLVSVTNLDLGFGIKYELKQLKSKKNLTDPQKFNFKFGAQQFLIKMCTHLKEKTCLKCLSPSYMVECSEACEILFQKLLEKLIRYKKIVPSIADDAKMEYSWFVSTILRKTAMNFSALKNRKIA